MSKHKLGICIPYRNRYEHLQKLVPRLTEHLNSKGIDHRFYVAHQVDDKLFNRGLMKNIAAKFAFDDGCDYIAWHDIDMLPLDSECDYSYPEKTPVHIATRLSKYDYKLNYEQYFGGVVLFTKEHVEKTNGYSNDYWDWGMEDDDLFYRAHFEGYTDCATYKEYTQKEVASFNGIDSSIKIPYKKEINKLLGSSHTISVLFKPEQQPEKYKDWLIGEDDKEFIEFPVFRKQSYCPYSISFNNSRAVTSMVYNANKELVYNWIKRNESVWSWVTISYDENSGRLAFYLNDELAKSVEGGIKENRATVIPGGLLKYDDRSPIFLGTNADKSNLINLKGEIAEVKIFNAYIEDPSTISSYHASEIEPILHYNFVLDEEGKLRDQISGLEAKISNIEFSKKDFRVESMPIPYRIEGSFVCLPHEDEGFVDNKWAKGKTTARNEKRFVTEMQQRLIDYKSEGFNSMKYELVSTKDLDNNVLLINCKA
jgi:hypothetical protein